MFSHRILIILFLLGLAISTSCITIAIADEHQKHHSSKISDDNDDVHDNWNNRDGDSHRKKNKVRGGNDDGNETTGQIAGWLFAFANITVVFSLLSKISNRYLSFSDDLNTQIKHLNQLQKKYLNHIHYIFNVLALCVVFVHFLLSSCRSTMLPEIGMMIMACLIGSGVMVKFRVLPKPSQKWIYTIHTHFLPFLILVITIILGHSVVG